MVTAPVRRELVRWMQARGMTERRCLAIAGMSARSSSTGQSGAYAEALDASLGGGRVRTDPVDVEFVQRAAELRMAITSGRCTRELDPLLPFVPGEADVRELRRSTMTGCSICPAELPFTLGTAVQAKAVRTGAAVRRGARSTLIPFLES